MTRIDQRTNGPRASRRGFGMVFGVIVLFLVTMMVMGFAQYVFGNRVATGTQASVVGTIAVAIGQSAIEEAWRDIALSLNDRNHQLYKLFRKIIRPGRELDGAFKFTLPVAETLASIEKTENWGGFKVKGGVVNAEALGMGTMAGLTFENLGAIKLTATIRHGPTGVARTAVATRGFKVALLSTPRPFDQATFFVLDPEQMLDPSGVGGANLLMQQSLEVTEKLPIFRQQMNAKIKKVIDKANEAVGKANSQRSQADPNAAQIDSASPERYTSVLDQAQLPPPPKYSPKVEDEHHMFPTDGYVVFSLDKQIPDLSMFNVARQVAQKTPEIDHQQQHYATDAGKVNATLDEIWKAIQEEDDTYEQRRAEFEARLDREVKKLKESMTALSRMHFERLAIYKGFTDFFTECSGPAAVQLAQFGSRFDINATQSRRAFYAFTQGDTLADFAAFMNRYKGGGAILNAVVLVNTNGKPLRLERTQVTGKLVLLVQGPAEIDSVTLTDTEQDLLTLQVDGPLRVNGSNTCSAMVSGDLQMMPGAEIKGNVILKKVNTPDTLGGSIVRDERYQTSNGGKPEEQWRGHFVVALSPVPASFIVERHE